MREEEWSDTSGTRVHRQRAKRGRGTSGNGRRRGSSSDKKNKKKRRVDEDTVPDEIINQAFAWLQPQDLARATQVCKRWNEEIIHQYTWKQAAENTKPEALIALEQATTKRNSKLTSKAMAVGLAKLVNKEKVIQRAIPDPTIKEKDIFLLVELRAFNTTKAWCKSLSDCVAHFNPETWASVEWEESSTTLPFHVPVGRLVDDDDWSDLLHDMSMTVSMWRQDTGQFVSLCVAEKLNDYFIDDVFEFGDVFEFEDDGVMEFCCYNRLRPIANTDLGVTVRSLCQKKGYNCLEPSVLMRMKNLGEGVWCVSLKSVDFKFAMEGEQWADKNLASRKEFLLFLETIGWE